MAAPLYTRKTVILVKNEDTYGVQATATPTTDAILTTIPSVSLDAQVLERNYTRASFSPTQPVIGRKLVNVGFQTELKSQIEVLDGVDTNPLEIDPVLRMAGLDPTYTVETSPPGSNDGYVTYAPISDAQESATLYVYSGNQVKHIVTGAYCNLQFEFVAGQYPIMTVDIRGKYIEPSDAAVSNTTYATDIPVQSESLSLAFGAVTGTVVRTFTLNMNNEIIERPDLNSTEGLKGLRISGRRPTISFRVEKELVSTWNIYNALDIGTTYSTTFTHGSSAGQKILVTIPKLVITNITEADDAGIAVLDVEGLCAANSGTGDDEFTLKFF